MSTIRVAVAGLGAVGLPVAKALSSGGIPGLQLVAASAFDRVSAARRLEEIGAAGVPLLELGQLAAVADVVVECLPPAAFCDVARPTLSAGKTLIVLSVTQLLQHPELMAEQNAFPGTIIVPTGALCGLDAVKAAAEGGNVESVIMQTRKPPSGLQKAPFVVEQGLDLSELTQPLCLFSGSVTEAAKLFPANVNVAVALALAGIGPDRTQYEIWADPGVSRNSHSFSVVSDESNFTVQVQGMPSKMNPATGALTPLSTIATLRGMVSRVRIGT